MAQLPEISFNRLGKLGLLVKQAKTYQTAQITNMTDVTTGVVAQYNSESDLQAQMGSSYISQLDSIGGTVGGLAQSLATTTVNRMIFRDNPRISQTLQQSNIVASLQEVIRQMKVQGATVLPMTVAATVSSITGSGNGIVNVSTRRAADGLVQENIFAETILLTCSQDSFIGNATAGNETFALTGTGSNSNFFAFNWPLGSGAQTTLSAIDGNSDNSNGNGLTNSNFATWVSGLPSKYTINSGGANLFKETTLVYDGSACLRWLGDGTTSNSFQQQFNNSAGTVGALSGLTQYSFNIFLRRDGAAPATGILTIDLVDQNGVVIRDANAVANSFTIDLTTLSTVYNNFTAVFRTPLVGPTSSYIRYRLTTGLTSGRSVYLAKASQGIMTKAYISGIYTAIHAGSIPFIQGDFATVVITNSRGSGATLSTWQTLFAQLFPDMINSELLLPSNASPTLPDSLIG